jgi:hypothetical protein
VTPPPLAAQGAAQSRLRVTLVAQSLRPRRLVSFWHLPRQLVVRQVLAVRRARYCSAEPLAVLAVGSLLPRLRRASRHLQRSAWQSILLVLRRSCRQALAVLPNPSLERTTTGVALGPRSAQCHHPPRGASATPVVSAHLKR